MSVSEVKGLPLIDQPPAKPVEVIPATKSHNSSATTDDAAAVRSVRVQYNTKDQFKKAAKLFGLMDDFKVGYSHYFGSVNSKC